MRIAKPIGMGVLIGIALLAITPWLGKAVLWYWGWVASVTG